MWLAKRMHDTKLTNGCVFYFAASVALYARWVKRLLGEDQDPFPFPPLSRGTNFFSIAKVWLLAGD